MAADAAVPVAIEKEKGSENEKEARLLARGIMTMTPITLDAGTTTSTEVVPAETKGTGTETEIEIGKTVRIDMIAMTARPVEGGITMMPVPSDQSGQIVEIGIAKGRGKRGIGRRGMIGTRGTSGVGVGAQSGRGMMVRLHLLIVQLFI